MRKWILLFMVVAALVPLWGKSYAQWETSMGSFRCILHEDLVPITANNFIDLAQDHFYDGLIFHRVIDDFMIQDGCPNGNGYGGPGYTIPDEFHPDLQHDAPGVLSMANAGPDTGGSQYFITLVPTPWLNNAHAVFGNIIEGMDVVYAIGAVETDANDRPIIPVVIDSVRIFDFQIHGQYPEENEITIEAGTQQMFIIFTTGFEDDPLVSWMLDGEEVGTNLDQYITFEEAGDYSVVCRVSDGTYHIDTSWTVHVSPTSAGDDIPALATELQPNHPNPFNPVTQIDFSIAAGQTGTLEIFDIRGRRVKAFDNLASGLHSLVWDGRDTAGREMPSGVYLYRLRTGEQAITRRMLLLK